MADSFTLSDLIPASPERVYTAWLDANAHSAMTGGAATVEARIGGRFTAWDGYIEGTTLELAPGRKIVQAWRSADFPEGAGTSRLEIALEAADGGTRITLVHTELPAGQGGDYEQGWRDHYFTPMRKYFSTVAGDKAARPATLSGLGTPPPPPAPQPIVSLAEPLPPISTIETVEETEIVADYPAGNGVPAAARPKTKVKAKSKAAPVKARPAAKKPAAKKAAATTKKAPKKKAAAKKPAKKAAAAKKSAKAKKTAAKKPAAKKSAAKKPANKKRK
jgi:uncharacterized protein YndB with AHSA1/START domain